MKKFFLFFLIPVNILFAQAEGYYLSESYNEVKIGKDSCVVFKREGFAYSMKDQLEFKFYTNELVEEFKYSFNEPHVLLGVGATGKYAVFFNKKAKGNEFFVLDRKGTLRSIPNLNDTEEYRYKVRSTFFMENYITTVSENKKRSRKDTVHHIVMNRDINTLKTEVFPLSFKEKYFDLKRIYNIENNSFLYISDIEEFSNFNKKNAGTRELELIEYSIKGKVLNIKKDSLCIDNTKYSFSNVNAYNLGSSAFKREMTRVTMNNPTPTEYFVPNLRYTLGVTYNYRGFKYRYYLLEPYKKQKLYAIGLEKSDSKGKLLWKKIIPLTNVKDLDRLEVRRALNFIPYDDQLSISISDNHEDVLNLFVLDMDGNINSEYFFEDVKFLTGAGQLWNNPDINDFIFKETYGKKIRFNCNSIHFYYLSPEYRSFVEKTIQNNEEYFFNVNIKGDEFIFPSGKKINIEFYRY